EPAALVLSEERNIFVVAKRRVGLGTALFCCRFSLLLSSRLRRCIILQRLFHGNAPVSKKLVGIDFAEFVFFEITVQLGDKTDTLFSSVLGDLSTFVAQAPVHFLPEPVEVELTLLHQFFILYTGRVDELYLSLSPRAFMVGDDPDIGADARVVEQLIREGD